MVVIKLHSEVELNYLSQDPHCPFGHYMLNDFFQPLIKIFTDLINLFGGYKMKRSIILLILLT